MARCDCKDDQYLRECRYAKSNQYDGSTANSIHGNLRNRRKAIIRFLQWHDWPPRFGHFRQVYFATNAVAPSHARSKTAFIVRAKVGLSTISPNNSSALSDTMPTE